MKKDINMKYIKRINEGWSDDYTYDFTDNGFKTKEDLNTVTGEYKGKFVIGQLNDWFAEMITKMGEDKRVVKTNTQFDEAKGEARFEVETVDLDRDAVEITINGEKMKFYPELITGLYPSANYFSRQAIASGTAVSTFTAHVIGRFENDEKKGITIESADSKITFQIGKKKKGIDIDKENIKKILDMIESGKIKNLYGVNLEERLPAARAAFNV